MIATFTKSGPMVMPKEGFYVKIKTDDYGNWRSVDSFDITKIEIIDGIYYESNNVAIV